MYSLKYLIDIFILLISTQNYFLRFSGQAVEQIHSVTTPKSSIAVLEVNMTLAGIFIALTAINNIVKITFNQREN